MPRGRPPKSLDTPALQQVAKSRKAVKDAEEALRKRREKFAEDVVAALKDDGMHTIARVAEVSTAAINKVVVKHGAKSPRA